MTHYLDFCSIISQGKREKMKGGGGGGGGGGALLCCLAHVSRAKKRKSKVRAQQRQVLQAAG